MVQKAKGIEDFLNIVNDGSINVSICIGVAYDDSEIYDEPCWLFNLDNEDILLLQKKYRGELIALKLQQKRRIEDDIKKLREKTDVY